jgi:hypothetical protein
MDFVMASSILGVVRDGAQMLLLGGSESLSLAIWGSGLLAMGALARRHHFRVAGGKVPVNYLAKHGSLTESRV